MDLGQFFLQLAVSEGAPLGGGRRNLGAVNGNLAQLEQTQFPAQTQQLHKHLLDQSPVLAPKFRNRVVVRMVVGRQITHADMLISGPLDFTGGEDALSVAVDQQSQHHGRRILPVTGAALVDQRA